MMKAVPGLVIDAERGNLIIFSGTRNVVLFVKINRVFNKGIISCQRVVGLRHMNG